MNSDAAAEEEERGVVTSPEKGRGAAASFPSHLSLPLFESVSRVAATRELSLSSLKAALGWLCSGSLLGFVRAAASYVVCVFWFGPELS